MSEKRIVILQVSGDCRYLRTLTAPIEDTPAGTYCAAYIHSNGWERIEPNACEKCTREKHFEGLSRKEVIEKMAKAIYADLYGNEPTKKIELQGLGYAQSKHFAESALNALLQEK